MKWLAISLLPTCGREPPKPAEHRRVEVHAGTRLQTVGAIAGYAAQRTLVAGSPPVMGVNINATLAQRTKARQCGSACRMGFEQQAWSLAPTPKATGASGRWQSEAQWVLASRRNRFRAVEAMFGVPSTKADGCKRSVKRFRFPRTGSGPACRGERLLKAVWPLGRQRRWRLRTNFRAWPMNRAVWSGKSAPARRWWSAIGAQA